MKAILIDPVARMLTELDDFAGGGDAVRRLIGCRLLDAVRMDRDAAIYFDDEGLADGRRADVWRIQLPDEDAGGALAWGTSWIVGRGLVVGTVARTREDADCPFSVVELAPRMGWRFSWIDAAREIARAPRALGYLDQDSGALCAERGPRTYQVPAAVARALVERFDSIQDETERIRFDTTDVWVAARAALTRRP